MRLVTVGLLAMAMFVQTAHGGTVLQGRDDEGGITVIKIQGHQARIETGDDSGYMLIHMKKQKVYSVNSDDRLVLDVSAPVANGPAGAGPTPTITKVGEGPKIAGYSTVQYRVTVGDSRCFDDYLAPQTLDNEEILRFARTMAKWSTRMRGAGAAAGDDECDAVADALNERYPQLGIPMRTVDSAGTVIHEITRIQTDETFPADIFALPPDFPVMTQQQLLDRMRKLEQSDIPQSPPGRFDEMQEDTQDMLQRLLEQE